LTLMTPIGKESGNQNRSDRNRVIGKISETYANLCPSTRKPRVDGARLGCLGMMSVKAFGILVEARGEGVTPGGRAVARR
jgi:hypothetical protein